MLYGYGDSVQTRQANTPVGGRTRGRELKIDDGKLLVNPHAGVLVSVLGNISMKRRLTQPVPHIKGPQRRMGIFFICHYYYFTNTHNHTQYIDSAMAFDALH